MGPFGRRHLVTLFAPIVHAIRVIRGLFLQLLKIDSPIQLWYTLFQ